MQLPSWALLTQLFLGFGWGRAAAAHAIEPTWWNGSELVAFVNEHAGDSVHVYRPFLQETVLRFPVLVAAVVIALELLTAALLLTNRRPELALTMGGFLNVQFILSGQVNPSVFYLVVALGLLLWHLDNESTTRAKRYQARRATALAVLAIAMLGPSVRTVDPEMAIEDPALVLIFLSVLVAATIWISHMADATSPPGGHSAVAAEQDMILDLEPLQDRHVETRDPETALPMKFTLAHLHTERATGTAKRRLETPEPEEQQPRIIDLRTHGDELGHDAEAVSIDTQPEPSRLS